MHLWGQFADERVRIARCAGCRKTGHKGPRITLTGRADCPTYRVETSPVVSPSGRKAARGLDGAGGRDLADDQLNINRDAGTVRSPTNPCAMMDPACVPGAIMLNNAETWAWTALNTSGIPRARWGRQSAAVNGAELFDGSVKIPAWTGASPVAVFTVEFNYMILASRYRFRRESIPAWVPVA